MEMILPSDLHRRLKTEIDKIPAIDTHVHINPAEPLAKDLAQTLYYHNYISELIAGGAPEDLARNSSLDGKVRVKKLLPELKRSPCSAHAWMLRELLRTVYDFEEDLTDKNWESLYETAERKSKEEGRLEKVCKLAGVEKILIHLPAEPVEKNGLDSSIFVGLSDLDVPGLPGFRGLDQFEKQTGCSVSNSDSMFDATVSYLKRGASLGQRGLRIGISPSLKLLRPGRSTAQLAFDRMFTGKNASDNDRAIIETFSLDAALTGAEETGMAVQVFVEGSFLGKHRIPSAEQSLAESIYALASSYPKVNFEVYSISAPLTQTLCLYCKYLRNFYLPGVWWLCQFPEIMKNTYALRLEMLPAVKWSAFFSDAYEVEWLAGKSAITRKELAYSLSAKVIEGYMTEDNAIASAQQVLYETPRKLYKID
jgi:hypothetical protein